MALHLTEQEYAAFLRQQGAGEKRTRSSRKSGLRPTEGDLKKAVMDYLDVMMAQGRLYYDRLNSGELVVIAGPSRRRVILCRPGTADFMVILDGRTVYVETKSLTGSQRDDQILFEELVTAQGAGYHLVRTVEEVMKIVEGN